MRLALVVVAFLAGAVMAQGPVVSPAAAQASPTAGAATPGATVGSSVGPAPADPAQIEADSKIATDDLYRLYDAVMARSKEIAEKERDNIKTFAEDAISKIRSMRLGAQNTVDTLQVSTASAAAGAAATATPVTSPAAAVVAPVPATLLEVDAHAERAAVLLELEGALGRLVEAAEVESEEGADSANAADAETQDGAAPAPAAQPAPAAKVAPAGAKPAVVDAKAAGAKAPAGAAAKVRQNRANKNALVLQPAPDQPDQAVSVRRQDDLGPAPAFAKAVAGQHSWMENLSGLLAEIDSSEGKAKALKLRLVEKENFLESLDKRRTLIDGDIKTDKDTLQMLKAHIKAINARVQRLKKERVSAELTAQQNQYNAAAKKLSSEVDNIQSVVHALQSRITTINDESKPLISEEQSSMAASLQTDKKAAGSASVKKAAVAGSVDATAAAPVAAPAADVAPAAESKSVFRR